MLYKLKYEIGIFVYGFLTAIGFENNPCEFKSAIFQQLNKSLNLKLYKVLFSRKGDPFLIEPDYFEWDKINLKKYIDVNRKINYGMIWAK